MYIIIRKKCKFIISKTEYIKQDVIPNQIHLTGTCKELFNHETTIVLDDTKKQRRRIIE